MIGKLLIATPILQETEWKECVILITKHHDDFVTGGICLNRPMVGTSLAKIWSHLCEEEYQTCAHPDAILYQGGPCDESVLGLKTTPGHGQEVIPGVFFVSDAEDIRELLKTGLEPYRIFYGYCGWRPGQLQDELRKGFWLVGEPTVDLIFSNETSKDVWKQAVEIVGREFLVDVGIDPTPNPLLN